MAFLLIVNSYLKQVINETLRISCLKTFTVRCLDIDVEIGGHLIPKETPVVHALSVVLKDEHIWPDPEKYVIVLSLTQKM